MNTVYYLCNSDKATTKGLLFPNELEEDTYSLGKWYVEIKENENHNPEVLYFKAIQNGELINLEVPRAYRFDYTITFQNDRISFRLKRYFERYEIYVGNSGVIAESSKLFEIVPNSVELLENICKERNFYFVGNIAE